MRLHMYGGFELLEALCIISATVRFKAILE